MTRQNFNLVNPLKEIVIIHKNRKNYPLKNVAVSSSDNNCLYLSNVKGMVTLPILLNSPYFKFELEGFNILKISANDLVSLDTVYLTENIFRGGTMNEGFKKRRESQEFFIRCKCDFGLTNNSQLGEFINPNNKDQYLNIVSKLGFIKKRIIDNTDVPNDYIYKIEITISQDSKQDSVSFRSYNKNIHENNKLKLVTKKFKRKCKRILKQNSKHISKLRKFLMDCNKEQVTFKYIIG